MLKSFPSIPPHPTKQIHKFMFWIQISFLQLSISFRCWFGGRKDFFIAQYFWFLFFISIYKLAMCSLWFFHFNFPTQINFVALFIIQVKLLSFRETSGVRNLLCQSLLQFGFNQEKFCWRKWLMSLQAKLMIIHPYYDLQYTMWQKIWAKFHFLLRIVNKSVSESRSMLLTQLQFQLFLREAFQLYANGFVGRRNASFNYGMVNICEGWLRRGKAHAREVEAKHISENRVA